MIWSVADGRGSDDEVARLHADERASLAVVDTLIRETEDDRSASVRSLTGDEREQVVADLTETLQSLREVAARLRRPTSPRPGSGRSRGSRRGGAGRGRAPRIVVGRQGRRLGGRPRAVRPSRTTRSRRGSRRSAPRRWAGSRIRAFACLAGRRPTPTPSPWRMRSAGSCRSGSVTVRTRSARACAGSAGSPTKVFASTATGSIVPTVRVRSGGRGPAGHGRGPVAAGARGQPDPHRAGGRDAGHRRPDRPRRAAERRRRPSSPRWSRRSSPRASSAWSCRRPRRR